MGDGFDVRELDDFDREFLQGLVKRFPKDVKNFMQRQGNQVVKKIKTDYRAKNLKKSGDMIKGVKRGRAYIRNGNPSVRVYNKEDHADYIEHGHVLMTHDRKVMKNAAGEEMFVRGYHSYGKAVNEFDEEFYQNTVKFVDEMLEGGRY
jgi:hypothetical protein